MPIEKAKYLSGITMDSRDVVGRLRLKRIPGEMLSKIGNDLFIYALPITDWAMDQGRIANGRLVHS